MKDTKPKAETPPLTRTGRKVADATLAAAKFKPTSDGKAAVRNFEVHGMVVTEYVSGPDAIPAGSASNRIPGIAFAEPDRLEYAVFELYKAAAKAGDAQGQHNLANMYLYGSGVEKDLTEAVRWCRKAAEQGLAVAQHNLAWMYLNGVGVDRDPAEALRWCQAAAEQGHEIAQRELPAYLAYGDQKRELADARNALNAIEVPGWEARTPRMRPRKHCLCPY